MFKVNKYFSGNVKSIVFSTLDCPAYMEVMHPGANEAELFVTLS